MAETRPYRVLKGKHGRWEDGNPVTYRPGDTMYLTEAQARRMTSATGSMVEPLWEADAPAPKATPETEPTAAAPLGLADLHWAKAAKAVAELETVEAVETARAEEKSGKDRKGVLDAVDARLAELEG